MNKKKPGGPMSSKKKAVKKGLKKLALKGKKGLKAKAKK